MGVWVGELVLQPSPLWVEHLKHLAPAGKSANVAVVDKDVDIDFAADPFIKSLFRVAFVYSVKLYAIALAESYCFIEELAFAVGPQYEFVAFGLQGFQGIKSKDHLAAYSWVVMLHNGAVKVNAYGQRILVNHSDVPYFLQK